LSQSEPLPQTEAVVLHDWTPLTETLDWRLGKLAYQARGTRVFVNNEVPNLLHQGGLIPYRAAEVLLANFAEAHARGTLADEIVVVEPGMGLGLFAVQVLDRLKARCAAVGVDWYDRLTWYATDATPAVLRDVERSGIFARHAGRVVLGQASAMQPAQVRPLSGAPIDLSGRIQAVFHSYVFCMLPMNLLQVDGDAVSILLARTVLQQPSLLSEYTPLSLASIQEIVRGGDPTAHTALVDLYPLLDLELALSPVEPAGQDRAQRIAAAIREEAPGEGPVWVLDSSGAESAMSATLSALRPDGFLLYRDYGPTTAAAANEQLVYQHYGATIAVQVNHYALERLTPAQVTTPPGELPGKVSSRLVGRGALSQTRAAFVTAYDFADILALKATAGRARSAPDASLVDAWKTAIAVEPDNWLLLTEAADAIFTRLGDPNTAYPLLKKSLDLNPWIQATAWDLLAEMFLSAKELGQAAAALEKSRGINPEHPRLYAALSRLHEARGEPEAAVTAAAQAVAWETDPARQAAHAARLQECISALSRRRMRDRELRTGRTAGGYHQSFSF
jgi:tetratricopeptide (TPR) repeat protein